VRKLTILAAVHFACPDATGVAAVNPRRAVQTVRSARDLQAALEGRQHMELADSYESKEDSAVSAIPDEEDEESGSSSGSDSDEDDDDGERVLRVDHPEDWETPVRAKTPEPIEDDDEGDEAAEGDSDHDEADDEKEEQDDDETEQENEDGEEGNDDDDEDEELVHIFQSSAPPQPNEPESNALSVAELHCCLSVQASSRGKGGSWQRR